MHRIHPQRFTGASPRWLLALALGALLVSLPSTAAARETETFAYSDVLTVVGVDAEARTLIAQASWKKGPEAQFEFLTDGDTEVQDALGEIIPLTALRPWDRVAVDARVADPPKPGGPLVLDRVQLVVGSPGQARSNESPLAVDFPDPQRRSDEALRGRVIERLAASRSLQGSDVWVSVARGHVTLRGLVPDDAAKQRALALARRTPGAQVVTDALRTDPSLLEWVRIQVRDEVLAREVAEQLAAEAFPDARIEEDWLFGWEVEGDNFEFHVDADMGTVTLHGDVPSAEDAERAVTVARRTPGVRSVHAELDRD